jgi:hypothetical protein
VQSNENLFKFAQVIIMAALGDDQKVISVCPNVLQGSIRFPISAWKMSADPENPIGNP